MWSGSTKVASTLGNWRYSPTSHVLQPCGCPASGELLQCYDLNYAGISMKVAKYSLCHTVPLCCCYHALAIRG
eukprot:COSAG01_NODE_1478_length_10164_cov_66.361550_2_plen_73_part_00